MGKKADFDKIQQLIESGDKSNINLAFVLAEAMGIDQNRVSEPWMELLNYLRKIDKLDPNSTLVSVLSEAVEIKSIEFSNLDGIPEGITKLKKLESLKLRYEVFDIENKIPGWLNEMNGLKSLSLENVTIPELFQFPDSIQKLFLTKNNLNTIPKAIKNISNLCDLRIVSNQITDLGVFFHSESFCDKVQLKKFKIINNPLRHVDVLKNLISLEEVSLGGCQIEEIDAKIFELPNLKYLDLVNNPLRKIRGSISLTNLKALVLGGIDADNTKGTITKIPDEVFNCVNLEILWIIKSEINHIPNEIGNLTALTELNLANNKLSCLPDSLSKLNNLNKLVLSGNNLSWDEKAKIKALLPNTKIIF